MVIKQNVYLNFDYFDFTVNSKSNNVASCNTTEKSEKVLHLKIQYDDFHDNYNKVHSNFEVFKMV